MVQETDWFKSRSRLRCQTYGQEVRKTQEHATMLLRTITITITIWSNSNSNEDSDGNSNGDSDGNSEGNSVCDSKSNRYKINKHNKVATISKKNKASVSQWWNRWRCWWQLPSSSIADSDGDTSRLVQWLGTLSWFKGGEVQLLPKYIICTAWDLRGGSTEPAPCLGLLPNPPS